MNSSKLFHTHPLFLLTADAPSDESDLLDLASTPDTTGTSRSDHFAVSVASDSDDILFGTLGSADHWDNIPDVPQHPPSDQPHTKKPRHSSQDFSPSHQQYNVYSNVYVYSNGLS